MASAEPSVSNAKTLETKARSDRGLLGRLLGRKGQAGADGRSACCLVAVMLLVDKALPIDGLIMELGPASLLFRPASSYILDRNGAEVSMRFGSHEIRGKILQVSARGYLVRLAHPLSQDDLAETLEKFGITDASNGFAGRG
jgi:hypothetical protein